MKPWKKLASKALIDDQWLRVTADTCELPDGNTIEPFYVVHENDFVHVFALTSDEQLILVRQYRHPGQAMCDELPGGIIDAGESPLEAAKRELREETGYTSDAWEHIGDMFTNPARQTNRSHIVIAKNCIKTETQDLDDAEEIEVRTVNVEEVHALIAQGEFSQAYHIASFYRALRHLSL